MSNTQARQNIETIQVNDNILNEIKCQDKLSPKIDIKTTSYKMAD